MRPSPSLIAAPRGLRRREGRSAPHSALEQKFLQLVLDSAHRLGLEIAPAALPRLRIVPARQAPSQKELQQLGLDVKSARFCRAMASNGDSSFWPEVGLVLLRHTSNIHLAEEAAHVLRHVLAPLRVPPHPVDAFYMRAVEEGLAFFASKLVCPQRPAPVWRAPAEGGDGHVRRVLRTAYAHLAVERGETPAVALYPQAAGVTDAVTHLLGYRLGDALYRAVRDELCDARKVRALFLRTTGGPGEACLLYWQLVLALRHFLLPSGARYDAAATPSRSRRPRRRQGALSASVAGG